MISTNGELQSLLGDFDLSSNITLLGQRNDIPTIMNTLDLHVLSSLGEAFPNVLAEAMVCKTPCVSTDVGDAKYIIGDTGWIVPPNNSVLLADAIEKALTEKQTNLVQWKKRKDMAKKRVENNFSIDEMVKSYMKAWGVQCPLK
jgi:glycosyltransferase involved in cell wall biosynthesis